MSLLTDISSAEATTYPASTLRAFGGARLSWANTEKNGPEDSRGTLRVKGQGQRADSYVTAWDSGYYDITIPYKTTSSSDLGLTCVTISSKPSGYCRPRCGGP